VVALIARRDNAKEAEKLEKLSEENEKLDEKLKVRVRSP
jgi:hypothetical protein